MSPLVELTTAHALAGKRDRRYLAPTLPASAYVLTGAELAATCSRAVESHPLARSRPESEREALAAILAERVFSNERALCRGTARDVLRYIGRVERFPTLAARGETVRRDRARVSYLRTVLDGLLSDSREWRDSAESYKSRNAHARGESPMVASFEGIAERDSDYAERDDREPLDFLTLAAAREHERTTGEPLPGIALGTERTLSLLAERLAERALERDQERTLDAASVPDERAITVALMAAMVPLPAVALYRGQSLRTCERLARRGREWIAGCDRESGPSASAADVKAEPLRYCPHCRRYAHEPRVPAGILLGALRECADATGDVRSANPLAPMLSASDRTKSAAVDAALEDARSRASRGALGSHLSGRVEPPSTRDVRTIAGGVAEPLTESEPRPLRDAAPFPAASAWRVRVRLMERSGHDWPATAAARLR